MNNNFELELLLKNYKEPKKNININEQNNKNIEDIIRKQYDEQIRYYKFIKENSKLKKGHCLRFIRKDLKNISSVFLIKEVIKDSNDNVTGLEITEIYGFKKYKINPNNYYLFTNYGSNIGKMKSNPIYSTEIAKLSNLFDDNYVKPNFDDEINNFIKSNMSDDKAFNEGLKKFVFIDPKLYKNK